MRNRICAAIAGAALMAAALPVAAQEAPALAKSQQDAPVLGLFTTLPILWGEAASLEEVLQGSAEQHWARDVMAEGRDLRPLDFLAPEYLDGVDLLLMAQPRGLAASENVALDDWVTAGGHVLLFADPMLTAHSRFGLGDRRRPQDVALLSPILGRWGLELMFDPDAPLDGVTLEDGDLSVPVALPGRFRETGDGTGQCSISHDGALARCVIGEGKATILADAALLDLHEPMAGSREALDWLLAESRN